MNEDDRIEERRAYRELKAKIKDAFTKPETEIRMIATLGALVCLMLSEDEDTVFEVLNQQFAKSGWQLSRTRQLM